MYHIVNVNKLYNLFDCDILICPSSGTSKTAWCTAVYKSVRDPIVDVLHGNNNPLFRVIRSVRFTGWQWFTGFLFIRVLLTLYFAVSVCFIAHCHCLFVWHSLLHFFYGVLFAAHPGDYVPKLILVSLTPSIYVSTLCRVSQSHLCYWLN